MSRIGKLPITIPTGVSVTITDDMVTVSGPKGTLEQFRLPGITVEQSDNILTLGRINEEKPTLAKHGLLRSLINNMVIGVTNGFSRQLEINGVGFRANLEGNKLKMALGFSHDVYFTIPDDIKINVEQNIITVTGISKQQVNQVAAQIRALKKPEPYKGKGIKYVGERIIRKSGKSGKEK
jgi:large subunit ribosomal protein L6